VDRIPHIADYAQHTRLARLAAGLAAPGRPLTAAPEAAPEDWEALPAFLKRNKLPLLTLVTLNAAKSLVASGLVPVRGPQTPTRGDATQEPQPAVSIANLPRPARGTSTQQDMREVLQREEVAFAALRAEYEIVRAGWLAEGIEGMLLKAVGLPPAFPHTSDNLDVYIPPAQGDAARQVLRRLGYVEMRHLEEPNKYLFKRFRAGQEVCAVHMHLRLEWSVSFLPEAQVWARRRPAADEPALAIPAPEDALLITLAHALYENKALKLGDVVRVNHCLQAVSGQRSAVSDQRSAISGWRSGDDG